MQRPLKNLQPRRLTSLFGKVEVRAPRFGPCRCGVACRRSITPVAEIMPDRYTPEYERVAAAMGASLSEAVEQLCCVLGGFHVQARLWGYWSALSPGSAGTGG